MRQQRFFQRAISFLVVGVLSVFCALSLSAKVMDDDIDFEKDEWVEGKKSISVVFPITATIDGSLLTIQCTTGRSDITVSITGNDGFSYEETYPASDAHLITIDLASAPKGSYNLGLSNQWGDRLTGQFEIK